MGRVALIICSGALLLSGCGHKQPTVQDSINHIQQSINQAETQNCVDDPEVC